MMGLLYRYQEALEDEKRRAKAMMSKEALFERIYNEVCDPWTLTEDERKEEEKTFYEALNSGDIDQYIKSIEETRDCVCRPDGVHGCYDFEEMRKFDCLIDELKSYKPSLEEYYGNFMKTYDAGDGFLIDIVELFGSKLRNEDSLYEAWMYHKGYGVKQLMFGMPTDQQTEDEFKSIVFDSIEEYKDTYRQDVMDWE